MGRCNKSNRSVRSSPRALGPLFTFQQSTCFGSPPSSAPAPPSSCRRAACTERTALCTTWLTPTAPISPLSPSGWIGLHLALEIAPSHAGILSVPALRDRLDKDVRWLHRSSPPGGGPSLETSLRCSIEQPDRWTRDALAQRSVFSGDFSIDEAEAIMHASTSDQQPLQAIQSLIDHSLLELRTSPDGPLFHMLRATRALAAEYLHDDGRAARRPGELKLTQHRP
jgi:hypothetical protein